MDGVTLKSLTVDFHEPGLVSKLGEENRQGFWFQLSEDEKKTGSPWGPTNPQVLNRYSYVQNGPVRYNDPSGHCGGSFGDNLRSVFDGSCLSMAVTTWENTSPGTSEHAWAAAYIGLSAVALVYGAAGGVKLIFAAGYVAGVASSTTGLVKAAGDLSEYGVSDRGINSYLSSYLGYTEEHLLALREILLRRQANDIMQLQNAEKFTKDAINARLTDLIDANNAIEAINRLIK